MLKGIGWAAAIEELSLASAGTAESFMSVASVTKPRRAHQMAARSIHNQMKAVYERYVKTGETDRTFQEWCNYKSEIPVSLL